MITRLDLKRITNPGQVIQFLQDGINVNGIYHNFRLYAEDLSSYIEFSFDGTDLYINGTIYPSIKTSLTFESDGNAIVSLAEFQLGSTEIWIDGIFMYSDYSGNTSGFYNYQETNSTTITFYNPPSAGQMIHIKYLPVV